MHRLTPSPLWRGLALFLLLLAVPLDAQQAPARPRPYPIFDTPSWNQALAAGTRTRTGEPGPKYWQQWADYHLKADLDPATSLLTGTGTIQYYNRSPDTLHNVYVQVHNNIYAPDAQRDDVMPVTRAVAFTKVAAGGIDLATGGSPDSAGYRIQGTVMRIHLPQALAPGASVELAFGWNFPVPPDGAERGGQDGHAWFVPYWYPQMAVYDDVNHWQVDLYRGTGEFYMGYGDYDVELTLPAGWLMDATGTLVNADQVLSAQTIGRLAQARSAADPVHVVTEGDRGAGKATLAGTNGKLTWHWSAKNVRDFAWGASPEYLWDATNAVVGDIHGSGKTDTSLIETFYRPAARDSTWGENIVFARHSIWFLSKYLWPYPYEHMTAMEGVNSCGGMEYPMMTCIGGRWDRQTMEEVTVHEIAHMWFPMQVGSDERRYGWMDEGLTQFDQSQGMQDFFKGFDDEARNRDYYLQGARQGLELPIMTWADYFTNGYAYGAGAYWKPATTLRSLRALLGEETFLKAYREYGRRWQYKHPTPFDFFNTFNDVSKQDLSWFWRTWFYETWTLDQAVGKVTAKGNGTDIQILDKGLAPMPARLVVTHPDGSTERLEVPVSVWLNGAVETTVHVKGKVTKVEIDPENNFPDIDRSNNVWPAKG